MSQELLELQQTLYASKNPTRRWLHCTRRDWIVAAVEQAAKTGRNNRALEIGPGSGVYLPTLARSFREVTAVDIEAQFLSHASGMRAMYPQLSAQVDDITRSKLPSASFDLVLCTEVVEHIADSANAIKEMRRILRPGGTLVLSTPQPFSPLELACRIAFLPGIIDVVRMIYREPILPTGHINLMSARKVQRQLTDAGFTVERRHKSGMYIPVLAEGTGEVALNIEKWLEKTLLGGPFDGLLWTQYYVARAT